MWNAFRSRILKRGRNSAHTTNGCNVVSSSHPTDIVPGTKENPSSLQSSCLMSQLTCTQYRLCPGLPRKQNHCRPAKRTHNLIQSVVHKHTHTNLWRAQSQLVLQMHFVKCNGIYPTFKVSTSKYIMRIINSPTDNRWKWTLSLFTLGKNGEERGGVIFLEL